MYNSRSVNRCKPGNKYSSTVAAGCKAKTSCVDFSVVVVVDVAKMTPVSHISWKTGWRRSSLAEGLRFGSSSRQRRVRSFKAGDRVSGTLGGSCAHAILNISARWFETSDAPQGGFPVAISMMRQPRLQMSQLRP